MEFAIGDDNYEYSYHPCRRPLDLFDALMHFPRPHSVWVKTPENGYVTVGCVLPDTDRLWKYARNFVNIDESRTDDPDYLEQLAVAAWEAAGGLETAHTTQRGDGR